MFMTQNITRTRRTLQAASVDNSTAAPPETRSGPDQLTPRPSDPRPTPAAADSAPSPGWPLRSTAAPSRARAWPCRCDALRTLPRSGAISRASGLTGATSRTIQSGSRLRRNLLRRGAQVRPSAGRRRPSRTGVAGDGQEPLAAGGCVGHRPQVQIGHIAHVDDVERQSRAPGIAPSSSSLHHDGWTESRARAPARKHRPD